MHVTNVTLFVYFDFIHMEPGLLNDAKMWEEVKYEIEGEEL